MVLVATWYCCNQRFGICSGRCGEECTGLESYRVCIFVPMLVIGAFLSQMTTAVSFWNQYLIETSHRRLILDWRAHSEYAYCMSKFNIS